MPHKFPPAVRYPLQRSKVLAFVFAVASVLAAGVVLAWWLYVARSGASHRWLLVAGLGWWLAVLAQARFWLRQPLGELCWTGGAWVLALRSPKLNMPALPDVELAEPPEVLLDLQTHLVVRIVHSRSLAWWVWIERKSQPERWMDLRRAVYSRARMRADSADDKVLWQLPRT